jgi:hypothetical protein
MTEKFLTDWLEANMDKPVDSPIPTSPRKRDKDKEHSNNLNEPGTTI